MGADLSDLMAGDGDGEQLEYHTPAIDHTGPRRRTGRGQGRGEGDDSSAWRVRSQNSAAHRRNADRRRRSLFRKETKEDSEKRCEARGVPISTPET